jgi:hypothetical protein
MIEPARTMMTGVLHETRTRGGKDEVLAMAVPGAKGTGKVPSAFIPWQKGQGAN